MNLEQCTEGKRVAYKTHKTEGVMKITGTFKAANGQVWITGHNKDRGVEVKVYPSQCAKIVKA